MSKSYDRYYPETVMFLGAGSVVQLMSSTDTLAKQFTELVLDDKYSICEKWDKNDSQSFKDLIRILSNNNEVIEKKATEYEKEYSVSKANTIKELKELSITFDYACIKAIAETASRSDDKINFQELITSIDIMIRDNRGYKKNDLFYNSSRIVGAKNFLLLLQYLSHLCETRIDKEKLQPYKNFYAELAKRMQKEAIDKENKNFSSYDFILFSYAIISFNWEPLSLGMLFEAHKKANDTPPYLGKKVQRLGLFNDFGLPIAGIRKENNEFYTWYQGQESIAFRLNDPKYSSRVMRVGKYMFPHGGWCFRICPSCGKTNMIVRDISHNYWNYFGPTVLPEFNNFKDSNLLTEKELKWFKDGKFDAIECYYCHCEIRTVDTQGEMQSVIKDIKPPIFQETVNESAILVQNAKHLLFNGYSLPPDDTFYRSLFSTALAGRDNNNEKLKVSVLNYSDAQELNQKIWYNKQDLKELKLETIDINICNLVKGFNEVFHNCEVRYSFIGFPNILKKTDIEDLMYPENNFN